MSELRIADRPIGPHVKPFVVAELSGNHNQSLERALQIVDAAADSGADALKIQTYTADTLTLEIESGDFVIDDPRSPWHGQSLHNLYQQAHTPWEWHEPILSRARERGLVAFSTPFDETAVDFLETLDVPCYKIASFEIVHLPLIRKAAATGKPVILSTGMATVEEIGEAVGAARDAGCRDLVLLKCTSAYPAPPEYAHLQTIPVMRNMFECEVGLSDHTLGLGVAVAAVALGATLIEKHFTLDRAQGGVDAAFSFEPREMTALVAEACHAWQALGRAAFGPSPGEEGSLRFRRSCYVAADIKAGEILTPENLRIVRPGFGLPPRDYESLLGKTVSSNVARGTPMSWDLLL